MYRLRSAVLLLACAAASAAGCRSTGSATTPPPPQGPVVAEFAGERLTLREFEERYARSAGSREAAAADSLGAYEDFLTRYVDFRLKVREAHRAGLSADPEVVREIREYRDQLAAPYLLEREVMEGIVRDLYEKQQEELRASHILLFVDPHAAPSDTLAAYRRLSSVRDSILSGALDFAVAARRHSEDPSRVQNNGDLGWFTGGRMILPFENAAYGTPVGEVSRPFRTEFGYHILTVTGRRPAAGQIRAAHILLRLSPASTPADSARAHAQMREIVGRAEAGEPFEALAREYSEDPGSAPRGGDLGAFTRDQMVAPFAEAAFALERPGQLSDVVETSFGLHLIRLTERLDRPSYEARYAELKRLAEGLPRTRARRQEVGRAFRQEVGTRLDTVAVRAAIAPYPADSILARVSRDGFAAAPGQPLAVIGDSTVTLGAFGRALRGLPVRPTADQEAQLLDLADQYLNERAVQMASYRLEERDPEFRRVMSEFTDGVLLFRISEDSVWTAASRDTLGLRAFHAARADAYAHPERRRTVAFFAPSDSLLTEAAALLEGGLTPAQVVDRLRPEEDARPALRADTLYLAAPAEAPFDRALTLQAGGRVGPAAHRGERVLLVVEAVEPPRPMTFEEAYARVVTDYQDELERRFVQRLREEAGVRLYPERLGAAFAPPPSPPTASASR